MAPALLVPCNEVLTEENVQRVLEAGITEFEVLFIDNVMVGLVPPRHPAGRQDRTTEEAIIEIYRRLRSGDPPTYDTAVQHFENLFFNKLSGTTCPGRSPQAEPQARLDMSLEQTTLTRDDILKVVKYLIDLKNNKGQIGRHRPPRQPSYARGRRAPGEPVPHRPGSHGARRSRSA
jgi:DNA-directed RNA polymerase subunit beta